MLVAHNMAVEEHKNYTGLKYWRNPNLNLTILQVCFEHMIIYNTQYTHMIITGLRAVILTA
jgi:hypothetical protein